MISRKATRVLAILSLVLSVFVLPQTTADAKGGGNVVRMQARIAGVKAVAKYEERGTRLKFNFQLELATPAKSERSLQLPLMRHRPHGHIHR